MNVIKSNGKVQEFDLSKIVNAIKKANKSVEKEKQISDETIDKVVKNVVKMLDGFADVNVDDIHNMVERSLMKYVACYDVARAYVIHREEKRKSKKYNAIEEQVLALTDGDSTLRGDNANKHIDINSSLRDYIAGITCKSIADKILPKEMISADKKGLIHWHDKDYSPVQPLHNCDLVNGKDMLSNGFQMGDTKIEPNEDTPFETACNLFAQINLQISGCQYGGQTVTWSDLLPFIANSRRLIREEMLEDISELPAVARFFASKYYNEKRLSARVEKKLRKEIYKGVKTYQYQVLCHSSSNGQTPFVSNNLCLREAETEQELKDFVMLIEEILKRRIKGVKDSSGTYISPLFPKLLYWTCDGLNVKKDDPYFYLTELAAKCELERTQPDIVSEKETRRVKKGQIIPSMGCRSLLGPIWEENTYPIDTPFYWMFNEEGYSKMGGDERCYGLTVDTMTEDDFKNAAFPYGSFVEKTPVDNCMFGNYPIGFFPVNFRGNTGWITSVGKDTVTVLEPKVYGRWNNGVITVNIPHVALEARKYHEEHPEECSLVQAFFDIFNERLELVHRGLKLRYSACQKIKGKNSPILWQYGALARMGADETVGDLMAKYPQRASISVGYAGLYETCEALIGKSNTTDEGRQLSKEILTFMNTKCDIWKANDNINYSIYGTPEESLTYKFAMANRRDFGLIEKITDKDYVVNSYHVDPREKIDGFTKIAIEGEYLALSSGGAVSYVEIPDMTHNIDGVVSIIQWMHDHIVYAEINKKLAVCHKCGHKGGIDLIKTDDGDFKFRCPSCGCEDDSLLDVTARLCGYLGKVNAGNTNKGRLDDIYHRVLHFDNFSEFDTNI